MFCRFSICAPVLLAASAIAAADETSAGTPVAKAAETPAQVAAAHDGARAKATAVPAGDKTLSGMSILGNQEAPMALVIVPWKSSRLGNTLDISRNLDDSRQPVDRDVFKRELAYYEIRTGEIQAASK